MSKLRLAGVIKESIVDGPGIRFVVFGQGCPHRCPGCQNPQTHDFSGGYDTTTERLLAEIRKNPMLKGITRLAAASRAVRHVSRRPLYSGTEINAAKIQGL